ncbi:snapalysin family zinc-dependent metalloprotease [Streptomyces sp. NPDC048172]|uniref:snapalysin family zinc-dependent metalloprotease n=1 Tax=Streptomyces sp. NPDC048172 TaxID=3365505 RepID=UPI0037216637
MSLRVLVPLLAGLCALVGGQTLASAGTTDGSRARAAVVVTYDASGSAEFADAVKKGVGVWNESVQNVELKPAESGEQADVTVLADDGWPRAQVPELGKGTVWMGRQAVNEGHDVVRIASHEFGHILGLPDRKPGPCSSLMSGASAGPDCTNPNPNEEEKAEVESNFGSQYAKLRDVRLDREYIDRP